MAGERRKRGRPKGTEKFGIVDRKKLTAFADVAILAPGSKLAAFLKAEGFDEKGIRRAQIRWRREKEIFLEAAQLRREAGEQPSLRGIVAHVLEYLAELQTTATAGLERMAASFETERERFRRRELAEKGRAVPIDLENEVEVTAAIERYESNINTPPAELEIKGFSKLPLHLKLYAAAHLLHEFSLNMADKAARNSGGNHET